MDEIKRFGFGNNFLISKYEKLYFKQGDKDLSDYKLPEYTYRRKAMEFIAEKCKNIT
jgi:hypothetical protein